MDEFKEISMREKQTETRRRVLAHLQEAIREIDGYRQIKLMLDGDTVMVAYDKASSKRVNIECDSELAMILDVVGRIMY